MAGLLVYYQVVREGRSVRECVPGTSGIVCFVSWGIESFTCQCSAPYTQNFEAGGLPDQAPPAMAAILEHGEMYED